MELCHACVNDNLQEGYSSMVNHQSLCVSGDIFFLPVVYISNIMKDMNISLNFNNYTICEGRILTGKDVN